MRAGALALVLASLSLPALADKPTPLAETRDGVTVDWAEGTITASAGAAGDLRMPSADLARPGAERGARAAALAGLKDALSRLPLGGGHTLPAAAVDLAAGRARTLAVEYQSNGGAVVRLRVAFGDWLSAPPPSGPVLAAGEARLGAAPKVRLGKQAVAAGTARYRIGQAPADSSALTVKADRDGELVVISGSAAAPGLAEKLAGAAIVIYVRKVLP